MASYNEIDGVPSHASEWLLRDVLRKEWRFKGFVVSDYYAIWELQSSPRHARPFCGARQKGSVRTCGQGGREHRISRAGLLSAPRRTGPRRKVLKESQLDELVAPMLFWKFKMGLFDDPYVDPDEAERIVGCEANRKLALQAARETITLLKNENNLVPLNPAKLKTIAVIGPNAEPRACSAVTAARQSISSPCSKASGESRRPRQGALQRRLQNHHGRFVEPGCGDRQRS